jgi:GrpB-like predicted nucleotidyltransferase (UPF0157 family)
MKLGLKRDEIKIVSYMSQWHEEFLRIKKKIVNQINLKENCIEHIGSTAIKNMSAKPIIDIMIGVNDLKSLDKSFFTGLELIGFLRLKVKFSDKIVFAKFTDNSYEEKTHYIHLIEYNSSLWKNFIFFRDYLSNNKNAKEEYINLKLNYFQKKSTGIKEYTLYKEEFIKKILSLK